MGGAIHMNIVADGRSLARVALACLVERQS